MTAVLLALWAAAAPAAAAPADALSSLEENPSGHATDRVSDLYRKSKDPYARLWLVDLLYARVRQHGDERAMETLIEASRDSHAGVRRRAVTGLEAFRFLPESAVRETWLARVRQAAALAEADKVRDVQAAGRQLKISAQRWESVKPPEGGPPGSSAADRQRGWRTKGAVLAAVVSFQLASFAWFAMGLELLRRSGASGRAVLDAWESWLAQPRLYAFPAFSVLALLVILGWSLARWLALEAMPGEEAAGAWAWAAFPLVYLASGLACFLPAAVVAGGTAGPGLGASAKRVPGFLALGAYLVAVVWPWESLMRLLRLKPRSAGVWSWAAQTGALFAGCLAAAVMVREGSGWRRALERSSSLFAGLGDDPAAAALARPLADPFFWAMALSAPALAALSLAPALAWAGLKPAQMFGLWFVSDSDFTVGFGVWAGVLLTASWLAHLAVLGALHASGLVSRRLDGA